MSELMTEGGTGAPAPERRQSGMQIWVVCALFILVPTLLILAVKYFFGL